MSLKGKLPSKDLQGREWHIYTLSDPRTNEVRYVGWTTRLEVRLAGHISDAKSSRHKNRKSAWIRSLLNSGSLPIMTVVQSGTGNDWEHVEASWIQRLKDTGSNLTNSTKGGEGVVGWIPGPETITRYIARGKLRGMPPGVQEMGAAALRGKKKPPLTSDHRRKLSESGMGRVPTEATRRKLSEGQKGRTRRPYTQEEKDHSSATHPSKLAKHCKHGHELTTENTYFTVGKDGAGGAGRIHRACRKCRSKRANVARNTRRRVARLAKAEQLELL